MHKVKCLYCSKYFDADTEEFVKPVSNRYAHKKCFEELKESQKKEEQDRNNLYEYINKLFNGDYNYPLTSKLIKKYVEKENYTYTGIQKALEYHYKIKNNPIDKANKSIGIVPFVYKDAFNYYYAIWEANQKNETKNIDDYLPKEKIINILRPQRKIKKRKLFSFLDEEN